MCTPSLEIDDAGQAAARAAFGLEGEVEQVETTVDGSALLHPRAAEALVLAAAPVVDGPRPVAIVLEDGTVEALSRRVTRARARTTGLLSGRDWTFWWELRSWSRA